MYCVYKLQTERILFVLIKLHILNWLYKSPKYYCIIWHKKLSLCTKLLKLLATYYQIHQFFHFCAKFPEIFRKTYFSGKQHHYWLVITKQTVGIISCTEDTYCRCAHLHRNSAVVLPSKTSQNNFLYNSKLRSTIPVPIFGQPHLATQLYHYHQYFNNTLHVRKFPFYKTDSCLKFKWFPAQVGNLHCKSSLTLTNVWQYCLWLITFGNENEIPVIMQSPRKLVTAFAADLARIR